MGYGVTPPGYWARKKILVWTLGEGKKHPELERAFDIWESKVGVKFVESAGLGAEADFKVKNDGSTSQWSPSMKTLFLKGTESLGATLHEVGHLLGMSHEHDRPDRRGNWYKENPGRLGEEESIRQAEVRAQKLQTYGEYDSDSIMQYPESKYLQMDSPSQGDIEAVKAINEW
jgi:hypothetical protein